jgi:hypothetical protein
MFDDDRKTTMARNYGHHEPSEERCDANDKLLPIGAYSTRT